MIRETQIMVWWRILNHQHTIRHGSHCVIGCAEATPLWKIGKAINASEDEMHALTVLCERNPACTTKPKPKK